MALEVVAYSAKKITAKVQGEGVAWSTLEITVHSNRGDEDTIVLHLDDVAGVKIAGLYAAAIAAVMLPERVAA